MCLTKIVRVLKFNMLLGIFDLEKYRYSTMYLINKIMNKSCEDEDYIFAICFEMMLLQSH